MNVRATDAPRTAREAPRVRGNGVARGVSRIRDDLDEWMDAAERRIHRARRLARRGSRAVQDRVADTTDAVRRRPAAALAIAFVAGGLVALAASAVRRSRRRPIEMDF